MTEPEETEKLDSSNKKSPTDKIKFSDDKPMFGEAVKWSFIGLSFPISLYIISFAIAAGAGAVAFPVTFPFMLSIIALGGVGISFFPQEIADVGGIIAGKSLIYTKSLGKYALKVLNYEMKSDKDKKELNNSINKIEKENVESIKKSDSDILEQNVDQKITGFPKITELKEPYRHKGGIELSEDNPFDSKIDSMGSRKANRKDNDSKKDEREFGD